MMRETEYVTFSGSGCDTIDVVESAIEQAAFDRRGDRIVAGYEIGHRVGTRR